MIYIKIYNTHPKIIAIADAEIMGKYFEEGKMQIEINEQFYKGKKYSEEEAKKLIRQFAEDYASFNIVGKKSVSLAIELGIVKKENVLYIQGIPVALALT